MPTPQREHTTGIRSLTTAGPGNGHPTSVLYAYRGTGREMTPDQAAAHIAKSRTRLRGQALNVPGREDAGGGAAAPPPVASPRAARGRAASPALPAGHLRRARERASGTAPAVVAREPASAPAAPTPAAAPASGWCDGCDYRAKHCKCPGGPKGGAR